MNFDVSVEIKDKNIAKIEDRARFYGYEDVEALLKRLLELAIDEELRTTIRTYLL